MGVLGKVSVLGKFSYVKTSERKNIDLNAELQCFIFQPRIKESAIFFHLHGGQF